MKFALILFSGVVELYCCKAQSVTDKKSLAKVLNDSALLLNVKYHNYSEAVQLFDKAILIDSSYYPALANKMTLQLEAQQLKDALGTTKQIERLKAQPELYTCEGLIYYKLGNNDSCNVYLMKALQLYDTKLDTMRKEAQILHHTL